MRASWLMAVMSMSAAACVGEADRAAWASQIRERVQADVRAASGCAKELRAVAERDPALAERALELQAVPVAAVIAIPARPPATVEAAERSRRDIARSEATLRADLALVGDGAPSDPRALDRAIRAGEQARAVRARLCQARDVATTLVATARGGSPAETRPSSAEAAIAAGPSGSAAQGPR